MSYLRGVEQLTINLDAQHIFNMDEIPVYIDMVSSKTLEFTGNKNVDEASTGHDKSRFTVAITASCSGKVFKSSVILKGLKHVPKCNVPSNIVVSCANGRFNEGGVYA